VHDGRLVTLGASAILSAWDAATGSRLWRLERAGGVSTDQLFCGTAMSPLLHDKRIIAHVGDDSGGDLVAVRLADGSEVWRTTLEGPGYASPIAADFGGVAQLVTLTQSRVIGASLTDGEVLWTHEWKTSYRMLQASYAIGPRATPTVDGDRVYVVGATGRLFCFDVETGDVHWQKDFMAEYDTSVPVWGIVSSPLVDGDRLITIVGNEPDGLVIAFDKRSGEEIWRAIDVHSEIGYTQPIIYEAGGVRQLIIWHPLALASLDPESGAIYWEHPWEVSMGVTVATPVKSGSYLLVSQFFNGSLMMELSPERPAAKELWRGKSRSETSTSAHRLPRDPQ